MEGKNEAEENPSRGMIGRLYLLQHQHMQLLLVQKKLIRRITKAAGLMMRMRMRMKLLGLYSCLVILCFHQSQHENLSLEPVNSEILDSQVGKNVPPDLGLEEGGRSSCKNEEIWPLKGLDESEEFHGMQLFDVKGKNGKEFEESSTLQDFSDKEQSIYSTATFGSPHSETTLGGSTTYGENLGIPEVNEPSEKVLDFPTDVPSSLKAAKDDSLPCDAWWKRRVASLHAHAKEANAFWSIFVAAAVMGIVILGQRWQQERWQAIINNEKSGRILGPIARLKDVIVGGHRRGSFIRGSTSSDN
ncbi:ATG8-interacting protein 2-like [Populus alba x Populus x berolinensis]|uniref:ATG8-interacting protein 2-like n=1 Tax=Populus alba x Populus x berolinensis TaxID=444605 RepID=A0AAD6WCW3_9ROSI|nr:ATG8-interacting protein 2-like [Populus alba x Populus x berolinensis]